MPSVHVQQIPETGADLEAAERDIRDPGRGEVRVRVEACGVCHSDVLSAQLAASYPIVPGHEIAGVIDAVGDGVDAWAPGQRVGVGWYGGIDGTCPACRAGDFIDCANLRTPGLAYDGGYADAVVVPVEALAAIPDALSAVDAAPLMCAGVTTFNALRRSPARAGDLVAVLGVGGLGHLGVQFAARMGYETVAIARGADKESAARELGAHHYIDSTATDVSERLQALGGATVVLSTVTNSAAMAATIGGLGPRGQLVVLGVDQASIDVAPFALVSQTRSVAGHPSGTSKDSEDTLRFAALTGIRPVVETMPMADAAKAWQRVLAGHARFRIVLENA
ncbi:alcohol dehydrogenase catalytic domain-containing protein [Acidiferrimicrobium sp. IK]|uniref:alcohol dehydrogenase catalytic domain-containing protein n=1 Tax=Acidiferrimicrobium sp. IK TaxID=2871700 RepID=UPI0021CB83FB|nr:alcohol dehydrogenase catalytic domain-containing protein [Acidiferrimicrobium sp. IK]MCU4182739.1 alcohol dehydrogenase catalytic domain-containing protein [Acidiferrimicrobium sp. IK]